jgi:L-threonylcarbamoyladenylate synthase
VDPARVRNAGWGVVDALRDRWIRVGVPVLGRLVVRHGPHPPTIPLGTPALSSSNLPFTDLVNARAGRVRQLTVDDLPARWSADPPAVDNDRMTLYDCQSVTDRDRGVEAAVEAVSRGDLVVLPTDTVYGIGADAFKEWAVSSLQRAKGSSDQLLPVLIGSKLTLDGLTYSIPSFARDLIDAFWPGPLSLLITHASSLTWSVGDSSQRVMVRMPLHPIALEVLRRTGPMAITGANKAGYAIASTAQEANDQFMYAVSVYLDGGRVASPERSTIVDATGSAPVVVRSGAITLAQLNEVTPGIDSVASKAV